LQPQPCGDVEQPQFMHQNDVINKTGNTQSITTLQEEEQATDMHKKIWRRSDV